MLTDYHEIDPSAMASQQLKWFEGNKPEPFERPYTVDFLDWEGNKHSMSLIAGSAFDARHKAVDSRRDVLNIFSVRPTDELGL